MLYLELFVCYLKIGFCSFGGLSTISFLNQEMTSRGWMTVKQISDIVAIAEMTPGAMGINCATFVGIQIGGIPGAFCAVAGIMTPSLTLCMLVAHFISRFKENAYLQSALGGIRPVCIGMILAVVFSLSETNYLQNGIVFWQPVVIAAIALILLFKFKLNIPAMIGVSALLGVLMVR